MAQEHYSVEEMESILLDYSICTEDFLDGAICVGGLNRETMERVLLYHTGYRDFTMFVENEIEFEE